MVWPVLLSVHTWATINHTWDASWLHVIDFVSGYGLEERENPADFMLDIINDSLSAVGKSFLFLPFTPHTRPTLSIHPHPHTSHLTHHHVFTPHTYCLSPHPHTHTPHTHLMLHLTHCLILNPHTATRRRSIRKVKPANKLDLIKKYKHSEEARLIKEQLDLVHSETGQRARRRCGNYISYHCKRIPYYITSFFLQVVCMRVCVSSRTKGLFVNRPY